MISKYHSVIEWSRSSFDSDAGKATTVSFKTITSLSAPDVEVSTQRTRSCQNSYRKALGITWFHVTVFNTKYNIREQRVPTDASRLSWKFWCGPDVSSTDKILLVKRNISPGFPNKLLFWTLVTRTRRRRGRKGDVSVSVAHREATTATFLFHRLAWPCIANRNISAGRGANRAEHEIKSPGNACSQVPLCWT